MKVTILQTDIEWGRPLENIRQAEQLISQAPASDLYVLPEMWATGFATDPHGIAEREAESVSLEWMRSTARRLKCAICGSLAIQRPGSPGYPGYPREAGGSGEPALYHNRHYFIDARTPAEAHYDKHHLFSYGHEDRYYTPGQQHTIVSYMGFRLLLLTCYDLRFPLWSRYADQLQYDAIICVANWPESRQNAFQILTRARAIENQAYLIACNRVGDDQYSHYRGASCIVSPIGKSIAACPPNRVSSCTATLDHADLDHKRRKFRVLEERDLW
ncbi:MAG: nitrilase family protein [Prevotella sp.]|nr:nitrilase family protein [Prevotella sp.]